MTKKDTDVEVRQHQVGDHVAIAHRVTGVHPAGDVTNLTVEPVRDRDLHNGPEPFFIDSRLAQPLDATGLEGYGQPVHKTHADAKRALEAAGKQEDRAKERVAHK